MLPAEVAEAAQISTTRFEPEIFVPPRPGQSVRVAAAPRGTRPCSSTRWKSSSPSGCHAAGNRSTLNLEFLDGRRGAHVNISGISGVATKTTYATFLLHSLFTSRGAGARAVNTKALVFNVKGEDLLFLDHPNTKLDEEQRARYALLGLPAEPFRSVASMHRRATTTPPAAPDVASRHTGVTSFFWTLHDFCRDDLLPFLFADAEDDRAQYTMVIYNVMAQLRRAEPTGDGGVRIEGETLRTFSQLADLVDPAGPGRRHPVSTGPARPSAWGPSTHSSAASRAAVRHVERLIRADIPNPAQNRVELEGHQVTVVDLHNLHDRAKRFVVGVTVRRAFEDKESSGQSAELLFLVLDELNKYAPRRFEPYRRGPARCRRTRSLSRGHPRRGPADCERSRAAHHRQLVYPGGGPARRRRGGPRGVRVPPAVAATAGHHPQAGDHAASTSLSCRCPCCVEFPFPAWATRAAEAGPSPTRTPIADPFAGLTG